MILDTLHHAARYEPIHPLFPAAFAWLERFDPGMADGRCDIEADRLFALVQSYTTAPAATKRFEAHRRYIDIQVVSAGEEIIAWAPVETLAADGAFDPERDIGFHADPPASTPLLLRPGCFAILFPNDAHKPGCALLAPAPVRKIVLKVEA
jgi:YhcH/YjgK/YiaL family protein